MNITTSKLIEEINTFSTNGIISLDSLNYIVNKQQVKHKLISLPNNYKDTDFKSLGKYLEETFGNNNIECDGDCRTVFLDRSNRLKIVFRYDQARNEIKIVLCDSVGCKCWNPNMAKACTAEILARLPLLIPKNFKNGGDDFTTKRNFIRYLARSTTIWGRDGVSAPGNIKKMKETYF